MVNMRLSSDDERCSISHCLRFSLTQIRGWHSRLHELFFDDQCAKDRVNTDYSLPCVAERLCARYRLLPDLCELQVSLNCKSNDGRRRGASLPLAQTNELETGDSMTLVPLVGRAVDSHKHYGAIARGIYDRSRLVSSVP